MIAAYEELAVEYGERLRTPGLVVVVQRLLREFVGDIRRVGVEQGFRRICDEW